MFHAGGSVCTLYAFCKWHCHLSGKIRILAHIFKISSTKGTSLNIYTWCQNHVFSASTGFLPKNSSGLIGEIMVPGCCQRTVAWQIGNIIVCISDYPPLCILEIVSYTHGIIRHYKLQDSKTLHTAIMKQADPMDYADFLVQSQSGY